MNFIYYHPCFAAYGVYSRLARIGGVKLERYVREGISGTGRPINFVFDFSCLLSAASEPNPLPVCIHYNCIFI